MRLHCTKIKRGHKTGYVADGGNIKRIDENGIVRKEWHDGQFMQRILI